MDGEATAARLLVRCLLNEGVTVVFGIPREENIRFTLALDDSPIRYVLTRHEQAASFMTEMYGRVTGPGRGSIRDPRSRGDPRRVELLQFVSHREDQVGVARLARPAAKVLAVAGDGAFLMNSQEIETAARERIPLVVLIWEDNRYGLIEWKMDLEVGGHSNVAFTNPDIEAYTASFGARGHRITRAGQLLPTLREALAGDGVTLISCPVDYIENVGFTQRLGQLYEPL